jgi:hypothetical protein
VLDKSGDDQDRKDRQKLVKRLRECKLDLGYQPSRGKTYEGGQFFSILTSFSMPLRALASGHARRPCHSSLPPVDRPEPEHGRAGLRGQLLKNRQTMRICEFVRRTHGLVWPFSL